MPNECGISVPASSIYNGNSTNWPVDRIGCSYMLTVRSPRASPEVGCERGVDERFSNRVLKDEIVNRIMSTVVLSWRGEAKDSYRSIIASGRKILVRGVEGDAFDMTRVVGKSLELLEGEARPHHHFGIQSNRYQYCSIA